MRFILVGAIFMVSAFLFVAHWAKESGAYSVQPAATRSPVATTPVATTGAQPPAIGGGTLQYLPQRSLWYAWGMDGVDLTYRWEDAGGTAHTERKSLGFDFDVDGVAPVFHRTLLVHGVKSTGETVVEKCVVNILHAMNSVLVSVARSEIFSEAGSGVLRGAGASGSGSYLIAIEHATSNLIRIDLSADTSSVIMFASENVNLIEKYNEVEYLEHHVKGPCYLIRNEPLSGETVRDYDDDTEVALIAWDSNGDGVPETIEGVTGEAWLLSDYKTASSWWPLNVLE